MTNPTSRFSSRVENYSKYRPSYPPAVVDLLQSECGLHAGSGVADIGSGTGLLAELLLKRGCQVFGVEPNREMREAGERLLSGYTNFTSVDGTAEATTLPDHSVGFVTAGQAFHWFDRARARVEFARILLPDGWVVLMWNDRQTATTPFLSAYEQLLLTYALDYAAVNHKQIDEAVLGDFFSAGGFKTATFANRQIFDFESLKGRLLSSSYTPEPGHSSYEPILEHLGAIFAAHQKHGKVAFEYVTVVFYGQLYQHTDE